MNYSGNNINNKQKGNTMNYDQKDKLIIRLILLAVKVLSVHEYDKEYKQINDILNQKEQKDSL
tara:strand:- start:1954 stop:2142 length:189 start_codon:yes stop_codon:yes gene_type:complete